MTKCIVDRGIRSPSKKIYWMRKQHARCWLFAAVNQLVAKIWMIKQVQKARSQSFLSNFNFFIFFPVLVSDGFVHIERFENNESFYNENKYQDSILLLWFSWTNIRGKFINIYVWKNLYIYIILFEQKRFLCKKVFNDIKLVVVKEH